MSSAVKQIFLDQFWQESTCTIVHLLDKLEARVPFLRTSEVTHKPQPVIQISAQELADRLAEGGDRIQFIDVREPEELALVKLEGFANFPLSQFAIWSETLQNHLDPQVETIVLCHHGVRSGQMCHWLLTQGFTHVKNVIGGIESYALQVDSTLPRY